MKIYLVGGAVRDELLGLPIKEKDWVVVGATEEDMKSAGFRQVGKDFPVFLHPKTHEEYALARREKKIKPGYTGFAIDASPTISLEDDLKRRDLTINAIAKTAEGNFIDPCEGRRDLKEKILRHISPAFSEDPVRILRVARFAARFNFKVAPATINLMRMMVKQGEADSLVAERVWKELERALAEAYPQRFFAVLEQANALDRLFSGISGKEKAFLKIVKLTSNTRIRFAVLLHSLQENQISFFCDRYRIPNDYRELAIMLNRHLPFYQRALSASADELLAFFSGTDAFRRFSRFEHLLIASEICSPISSSAYLLACCDAIQSMDIQAIVNHPDKQAIAESIKQKRLEVVEEERRRWKKKIE